MLSPVATTERTELRDRAAEPRVAVIASTMRSGSTLLKALLAEAPDISNLPEVNFQSTWRLQRARQRAAARGKSIAVLKRPAWYQESATYPRLPDMPGLRTILLVRDVYPTILSLRKMTFGPLASLLGRFTNRWLVNNYWARITGHLLQLDETPGNDSLLVRYEDIVSDPVETTAQLFRFLGSRQTGGVSSYRKPIDYRWRWGRDDAGSNIRTLQVQKPPAVNWSDPPLVSAIQASAPAMLVRQKLGYPALPPAAG